MPDDVEKAPQVQAQTVVEKDKIPELNSHAINLRVINDLERKNKKTGNQLLVRTTDGDHNIIVLFNVTAPDSSDELSRAVAGIHEIYGPFLAIGDVQVELTATTQGLVNQAQEYFTDKDFEELSKAPRGPIQLVGSEKLFERWEKAFKRANQDALKKMTKIRGQKPDNPYEEDERRMRQYAVKAKDLVLSTPDPDPYAL